MSDRENSPALPGGRDLNLLLRAAVAALIVAALVAASGPRAGSASGAKTPAAVTR